MVIEQMMKAKVLVKRMERPSKSAGGIHIPKLVRDENPPAVGRVVVTGPKCTKVKEGDKIIFVNFAGYEAEVNNEEHLILDEADILAVVQ